MTPQPTQAQATFSAGVEALRRIEEQRSAREARMRNALDTLAYIDATVFDSPREIGIFVRAAAREGLGREAER